MGIFNFAKDAGQSLRNAIGLGGRDEDDLKEALTKNGVTLQNLNLTVKGSTVTVAGTADSQAEREKAILVLGNTKGVDKVEDDIKVNAPQRVQQTAAAAPKPAAVPAAGSAAAKFAAAAEAVGESKFYEVKSGDTLSKISQQFYGEAGKYNQIFEANKPMLKDPDEIYPGQTLRIPPES